MGHTSLIRVTRHVEFEMAHILEGYKGGCGNLHGHTYKIEVTVEGPLTEPHQFVMDFKELDKLIKSVTPDHKFVACESAIEKGAGPEYEILSVITKYGLGCDIMPCGTSAECMVGIFAERIQDKLPEGLIVCEVNLWETTNSHATWIKNK